MNAYSIHQLSIQIPCLLENFNKQGGRNVVSYIFPFFVLILNALLIQSSMFF